MKLRILNNSLRLRLSLTEVNHLSVGKPVHCQMQVSSDNDGFFRYEIAPKNIDNFSVELQNKHLIVWVPNVMIKAWTGGDEISLRGTIEFTNGELLTILIEKDFKCLTSRPGEDESDLYPHPEDKKLAC